MRYTASSHPLLNTHRPTDMLQNIPETIRCVLFQVQDIPHTLPHTLTQVYLRRNSSLSPQIKDT